VESLLEKRKLRFTRRCGWYAVIGSLWGVVVLDYPAPSRVSCGTQHIKASKKTKNTASENNEFVVKRYHSTRSLVGTTQSPFSVGRCYVTNAIRDV